MHNMANIGYYDIVSENGRPKLKTVNILWARSNRFEIGNCIQILNHSFWLNRQPLEHVYLLSCDNRDRINGILDVASGTENHAEISKRKVVSFLVLSGAKRFIIVHNHPNNAMYPSNDDVTSAIIMMALAGIMDMSFDGSYIVGATHYLKVEMPFCVA